MSTFDHTKTKASEALGISQERFDELLKVVVLTVFSPENTSKSLEVEKMIEAFPDAKPEELILIGAMWVQAHEKLDRLSKKLSNGESLEQIQKELEQETEELKQKIKTEEKTEKKKIVN